MTTTVTIAAHTAPNIEVKVQIKDQGIVTEEFTLQDAEVAEQYVYDGLEVSVKEVKK